mmetsp:Transcript_18421/g.38066  ORF Transcript_18421/g.38066 Transcript_18421/m.38066 type:complete len:87 (-) Transcript_18421:577-837(-)
MNHCPWQADIEERMIRKSEQAREEAQRIEGERTPTLHLPAGFFFGPGAAIPDGVQQNPQLVIQHMMQVQANAFEDDNREPDAENGV